LILDDWGLAPLTPEQGRDLLEVLDDRHGRSSTIVTSQLPVEHWQRPGFTFHRRSNPDQLAIDIGDRANEPAQIAFPRDTQMHLLLARSWGTSGGRSSCSGNRHLRLQ
jgi:IstB-like ATP binding protein